MKVIIFNSQSSFSGVFYNFNKIAHNRAELMASYNFQALQILKTIKAKDFLDYLLIKSSSDRVKKIQFHATIICKGREKNQFELSEIAHKWMKKMGYKEQPYLIFFHYDTPRNHVHIVSSRVNAQGNYLPTFYEGLRAYEHLFDIIGLDTKRQALGDFDEASNYKFSSRREFLMLLHAKKYILRFKGNNLLMIRYGKVQAQINLDKIYNKLSAHPIDLPRRDVLRDLFYELKNQYSTVIKKVPLLVKNPFFSPLKYTSDFINALKERHQIDIVFSYTKNRLPTDYAVIDHATKQVFNGKDIMPIESLIRPVKTMASEEYTLTDDLGENYNLTASRQLIRETLLELSNLNFEITPDRDDRSLLRHRLLKKRSA